MELLEQGATIHNSFNQGLISKEEALQLLDKWWDEVVKAKENVNENMLLNLMMMYGTITEKLEAKLTYRKVSGTIL